MTAWTHLPVTLTSVGFNSCAKPFSCSLMNDYIVE